MGSGVVSVGRRGRVWGSLAGVAVGVEWGGAYCVGCSSPSTLTFPEGDSFGVCWAPPCGAGRARLDVWFTPLASGLAGRGLLGGGLMEQPVGGDDPR